MEDMLGVFVSATDDRKVALILDQDCSNVRVRKALELMWQHMMHAEFLICMFAPVS